MKGIVHLSLLTLLFATSVTSQKNNSAATTQPNTSGLNATTLTVSSATTPTVSNATTPTVSNATTPTVSNATTPTVSKATTPTVSKATTPTVSNATTPTVSNATTLTAPGTTATPAPHTNSTNGSTTNPPITDSTTFNCTVTANVAQNSSTVTKNESTTTAGSSGSNDHCQLDSCGDGASCVSLNNTFFCLCSHGYYYNSSTCMKGKIFPGKITVKQSEIAGLENANSIAYEGLFNNTKKFFQNVFKEPDFGQTVIIKVSISPSARTEMRNVKSVDVEVVNIFAETTQENETTVSSKIDKEVDKSDYFSNYIPQGLCDFYGCEKNAQDDCSSGRLCKCKEGWERIHPQVIFCFAPRAKCPDKCTTDHNKQCLMQNDGGAPHCACLPGYRANDDGTCQKCAFGYSGVDCKDKFELILIIVGTIAGVLILSMVIALIVSTRSNNKSKNSEEQKLIDNEFQNLRLQQTGFINQGAEGSLFPKVRTTVPRGNQPQNPYSTQLPLNQRGTPYLNY